MILKITIIFCLTFSLFLNGGGAAFSHQAEQDRQSDIEWYEWGEEAFNRAEAEDKLILLDLTAVWCHACHVMDQTTYSDPQVLALLQSHFIPIRVDTDQRPDLEARYRSGGWPTTSVLLPTGEVLFEANSLEPDVMVELLQEARVLYESEKEDLRTKAAQLWDRVKSRVHTNQSLSGVLRSSMARHSVDMMKMEFDAMNGGFRDHPKFFEPNAIQMALAYGFFEQDAELMNMGLTTLNKQVVLLDPVWGGFYRYAEQADWSQPHFEKMLTIQAQNLHNYLYAFQLTGNVEYKHIAIRIIDYVETFLSDHQTSQFFESQDADVRDQAGITLVSGAEYFSWEMIHRKAHGMPFVDRRMYTGSNADMSGAYLHASHVLENSELQERALKVLKQIVVERFDATKGVAHGTINGAFMLYGELSDHVRLGQALVTAFHSTKDPQFLQDAEAIARINQELLHDRKGGGFFDRPLSSDNLGLLNIPTKPARENIQAARFYLNLFHLTDNEDYRSTAEHTLLSVVGTPQPLPVALMGLAADEWFRPPVHIAIVGMPDDVMTQTLLLAGQQVFCPGKIMRSFDPREGQATWGDVTFPYDGRSVAFVCTDQICLAPVFQAKNVKGSVEELIAVLKKQPA